MRPLYNKPTSSNYNEISKYINDIDVTLPIDVCESESAPCEPCGCSGPCDEETPCPEGCACVDGVCVAATTHPCDCFADWPSAMTLNITGLEDYFLPGNGRCNCPTDGYAAGFNQTVVLDYAGEITYDGCPGLPGDANYRSRTFAWNSQVNVGSALEPLGVAVYRGSMTNGDCDEYGVEVLLFPSTGYCTGVGIIDKLAAGSPSICEPWVLASLTCNWWKLDSYGFNEDCSAIDWIVTGSYYGGGGETGEPVASGTPS